MSINIRNIIFIVLAITLVYLNCLGNGFVWDDIFTVVNNDFIRGPRLTGELLSKPLYYFADAGYLYYRPFQGLTNMLDYSLWGLNPFGFHLTNLLLHILAAVLVYYCLNLLFGQPEVSLFASLLFALHPVNRSVVNHITSRANILLAIFIVSSLMLFLKAKSRKDYLLSLAFFILALLSKETAVIFPFFLIFTREMYLKINKDKSPMPAAGVRWWYLVFLAAPLVYILFRSALLGIRMDIVSSQYKTGFLSGVFTLFVAIADYLKQIFMQSGFYMLRTIDIVQVTRESLTFYAIIISIVVLAAAVLYRFNRTIFFSLGMFFIWVLPVGSVALRNPEYYFQQKAIIEEHWLYIPAIGIFIIVAYLFVKLGKYSGRVLYRGLFLALLIYLSAATFKENTFWKNNYTIFKRTMEFVDNSSTLYKNMGWVYLNRKENSKAIDMYSRALSLKQDDKCRMVLYKDLAYAYFLDNQADKAIGALGGALKIKYDYADAHAYLGLAYSKSDAAKAKLAWKVALNMDSFNALAFNNLLGLSRTEPAIKDYLIKKYEAMPKAGRFEDYKVYRALGMVYLYNGMHLKALENLEKAFNIDPYDVRINNALAVYYAEKKDFQKAAGLFKRSIRLNPFDKEVYANLALLYREMGREEEAARLIEKSRVLNIFN